MTLVSAAFTMIAGIARQLVTLTRRSAEIARDAVGYAQCIPPAHVRSGRPRGSWLWAVTRRSTCVGADGRLR